MEKNSTKINKMISWFFLLYFVILFIERAQSLFRAVSEHGFFPTAFDAFANITVALSLCAALVLLIFRSGLFFKSLFMAVVPNYSILTIISGVILVSGMIHTEFTIPGIQFASYGMLIFAMILRTAQLSSKTKNRFVLWYSLCYLTLFSMAIPVVYHSHIELAVLFHIIEAVVMLLLVLSFTIMLRKLFTGKGENLLLWAPFIIMAAGDAVVLWMRWNEEINYFVLIFAVVSAVAFLAGKLLVKIKE